MSDTNIFGEETSAEFDLSDEALGWVDAGTPDEQTVPSAEAGETEDDAPEGDNVDEQDLPDENDDDVEVDLPEAFRGKSPAELVKIIQDSQSQIGRQANEVGELRKQVEAILAQQQAPEPQEYLPASEYVHSAADGVSAYRDALELLDSGQIGPDAIDDIIDATMEVDRSMGMRMHRDFSMRLARAEIMAQMAPGQQVTRDYALRQATEAVRQADADAEAYAADIARMMDQPQTYAEQGLANAFKMAQTPQDIQTVLNEALRVARGADPTKSRMYSAQLDKRKQDEQVETGNATPAEKPLGEAEQILAAVEQHRKNRPDADLFANFGG
jgi:hypothetical protein